MKQKLFRLRRYDGGIDTCEVRDDGARIVGSAPPDIVDTCARCGVRLVHPTEQVEADDLKVEVKL